MTARIILSDLSIPTIQELSRLQREPAWLLEKRLEAFNVFESSPLPSLQAGLGVMSSPIDLTSLSLTPTAPTFSLPAGAEAFSFADTPAALHTQLFHLIDPRDKWSALSAAFFTSSLFVRIPRGVQCTEPLQFRPSTLQRIVLLVEEGASATVIETPAALPLTGTTNAEPLTTFSSVAAELTLEAGARLQYASFPAASAQSLSIRRAVVGRDASLSWFHSEQNSSARSVHTETSTLLNGEGAATTLTGLFSGSGQFDVRANAFHRAPHTTSDMLFRGALTSGRALVRGLVNIHQRAPHSNGYQKGDILLLGQNSEAAVIPDLEIDNNDVRCTHGATVSRPDAEKLFYLQSRGLSPADALTTLVSGFFQSALSRFPVPAATEKTTALLSRQLEDFHG